MAATHLYLHPGERLYDATDVATFRHHYDAVGAAAAAARDAPAAAEAAVPLPPAHVTSARLAAHVAAGHADPRHRAHYMPTTKHLLASLAALRCGLQDVERARRRRNAALQRDPADWEHITWAAALPAGTDSPYPL